MKKFKRRVRKVLITFWEYKYSIVAMMLIVAVLLSTLHYFENGQYASANISFNYSEASNGLNPNNTRFNAYEMVSEDVMQKAIELSGLQESVTASQLAECVNIVPVDTGNAGGNGDYISTTYSISLNTENLDIQNRTSMTLLENICKAYKQYFLTNNGDNQEILRQRLAISTDCEPYLRLNEIKVRVKQLEKYLNSRMSQNRAFSDSETGTSFDEFDKRLKNIIDYDIPNTSAFIIECGVAKSAPALSKILEYKNKMDQITADKQMAYYEADNNGIKMYEKLMSSIVMIPTLDEQEQYYMSRTKTAMDRMARAADAELIEATDYKAEIVSTSYVISKITTSQIGAANLGAAIGMINKLENGLNDLSDGLLKLDKSYIEYKSQNYITFNYNKQSTLQRIEIEKTLKVLCVLLAFCVVAFYVSAARKEKNNEEI